MSAAKNSPLQHPLPKTLDELIPLLRRYRPKVFDEWIHSLILAEEGHEQDLQWERARKPRRSKKRATHRSVTIDAMRAARKKGDTLNGFLDVDHETVTVRRDGDKGYIVDCDSVFGHTGIKVRELRVSKRQLQAWWVEAKPAE
jgi:hypothetical protein